MKIFKKLLIIFTSVILIVYGIFFIVVYSFGNLNSYKNNFQKIVKETSGLDIDFNSAKLTPTIKVEIKLDINNLTLKYPDDKKFVSVDKIGVKIPVLPIILGDIKLSEIKIIKPEADFSLTKSGDIDLLKYLEPYLEKTQNSEQENVQYSLPKYFKISTNMPDVKISNYTVGIFDENINQNVLIKGDNLNIVKFDLAKGIKILTKGQLKTENQTFADYDFAIETFFPKSIKTEKQNSQTTFVDPFKSMIKYGFYTNILADLKISESKTDGVNIKGNLDLKELNLKHNITNTKGTYVKMKFDKNTVSSDAELFLSSSQKAKIIADLKYGTKNSIEADIKSNQLDLVHFINIAEALCNTLGMDNDFNLLKVKGYISSNFSVKSDFKKLESNGHIYLKEGQITHKSFPANVSNISSDINLNNNKISITNTKALVNGQPVNVSGIITQNADCDLTINSNNLSLPGLFEIFADKSLKNIYKITSGILDFDVIIKGKLDKLMPKADIKISNLNLTDKINHYTANVPNIDVKADTDLKTYGGTITLGTTKVALKDFGISALAKNLKINFDDKDLSINPFDIDIQNSVFKTQGTVKNYAKNMSYDISTKGNMNTQIIMNFIPKEFLSMISNKGTLPVIANIKGDSSAISINADITANANNYITPIHITQLMGKPSTLKADVQIKGNDLIINNLSLDNLNTHFADIKGQILSYSGKDPVFKNLKINTPNSFSFSIPDLANSLITLTCDLTLGGSMNNPSVLGNINISKLAVPSFKLTGENIAINMIKSLVKVTSNNIKLADSDIQFNMDAKNSFSKIFTIDNLIVTSNNFDLGKVLTVMSEMPQNSNAPGTDFPLVIKSGHGNIKNFKMDAISTQNTSADFTMADNTLYLNNIKTTAYKGIVEGNLNYNLQYLRLKAKIKGQNLNANETVTAFLGLKDQMIGNLNFNANVTMSGSEFKQQMQTLKGSTSFVILDGQMGSLGKFEHFLYAQNLLSQSFVKTSIGSIASSLAPKNTGKFTKISGDIGLSNGWAQIVQVTSSGPNMSLYLTGKFNLLNNYANIDILGKISKEVANSLGIVSDLSLDKLTASITSKLGTTVNKMISGYNVVVSKENLDKIPALSSGTTEGTRSFKVKIDGNIESLSAVKSFMWLMNETEAEAKKKELIENSQILNKMPNLKEKILDQTTNKTNSQTTSSPVSTTTTTTTTTTSTSSSEETYKPNSTVKEDVKNEIKNQLQNKINNSLPDFLDDIGTKDSKF